MNAKRLPPFFPYSPDRLPSFSSSLPEGFDSFSGFPETAVYAKVETKTGNIDIVFFPESDSIEVYTTVPNLYPSFFEGDELKGVEFFPELAERLVKVLNRLFAGKDIDRADFFKVVYNPRFDLAF